MSTMKPHTRWLVGAAAGSLLALLLVPATRWIVWSQVRTAFRVPHTRGQVRAVLALTVDDTKNKRLEAEREANLTAAAARYPADMQVQIAAATMVPIDRNEMYDPARLWLTPRRLEPLWRAHRDSPTVCPAMVRAMAGGSWLDSRSEQLLVLGRGSTLGMHRQPPAAGVLDTFRSACADGEAADPGNAFFPMMSAVALFAGRQDAEAIEALKRASSMSKWDDYMRDEARGMWRLEAEATGDANAVARVEALARILLPHYTDLRAMARLAAAKAILAERAGRKEEGFAVRRALAHCSGLMRAESPITLGSLVGLAMTAITWSCPGGETPGVDDPNVPRDNGRARAEYKLAKYTRYLDSIGHSEESQWLRDELNRGLSAKEAIMPGVALVWFGPAMPVTWLAGLWVAGLLVLINAGWIALMGALAARIVRRKAGAVEARPRLGVALAGLVGFGLGALLMHGLAQCGMPAHHFMPREYQAAYAGWAGLAPAAFLCALLAGVVTRSKRAGGKAFLGAVLIVAGCMAATTWMLAGNFGAFRMLQAATSHIPFDIGSEMQMARLQHVVLLGAGLGPALLLLVSAVVSLCCRVPVSVGWARATRGLAVPAVCVLLLAYSALTIVTARTEAVCSYARERIVTDEGHFLAEITGKQWPGPTP